MVKAGLSALALCCCCSFSSAETITVEEQVTEIVQVEVTREVTETVPVETTVTQHDQVNPAPTDFSLNGGVISQGDYIRFDYRGGTASTTLDLSQYELINSINHSFMATGCNNKIGGTGCADPNGSIDTLTINFTYGNQSWSNTVQPNNLDGWTNYSFDYTIDQGNWAPSATLQFYGIDTGFWGGWYGPITTPGTLDISYDMTEVVMQEITRTITEIVEQEVTRTITKTYEIPDPVQVDVAIPSIETVTPIETVEVAATSIAAPAAPEVVQVEVTNAANEVVATIEIDVAPVVAEIKSESSNQEVSQAEVEAKVEEALEKKSSGGSISVSVKDPFDPVQSAVAIAVMASTSPQGFDSYQAASVQLAANPFYLDAGMPGGTTYDNPAQRLFTGASEQRWDNMVESQWQR